MTRRNLSRYAVTKYSRNNVQYQLQCHGTIVVWFRRQVGWLVSYWSWKVLNPYTKEYYEIFIEKKSKLISRTSFDRKGASLFFSVHSRNWLQVLCQSTHESSTHDLTLHYNKRNWVLLLSHNGNRYLSHRTRWPCGYRHLLTYLLHDDDDDEAAEWVSCNGNNHIAH